jgi:DNA polymerase V
MFALVDCNSCFASCEQIYRPDLRGKPVVVLSNNDGCVVARSKEAKALDIPDLIAYFKVKDQLKKNNAHVFSSNYELYGDTSKRIMMLLKNYGQQIEVYSIDEAFLDVSTCKDLHSHSKAIKDACWKEQRMPVSVGTAPTKTLSKLANHIAKKSQRLNGVCVIEDPEPWNKVFKKLPVNKVWGVGSRLSKRLAHWNIYSVEDLRIQNPKRLRKEFGINLERTVRELNGECCIPLELFPKPKKEVFCSRSFSKKITCRQELEESIANYAARATKKLRKQNSLARQIRIMLQTSRFKPPYYFNSMSSKLLFPTNDDREVIKTALKLLDFIYRDGFAYAKAGVGLMDLTDGGYFQHDLFTENQSSQAHTLMASIDTINQRYGKEHLFFGRQGVQRQWSMAREFKSPAYTTQLKDVPIIKL